MVLPRGQRAATFSAWRRVMVKSGDSSSSSFQIERYLAPLANGRFTSTTPFKISHHNDAIDLDHTAIREKLLEVAPHRPNTRVASGVPRLIRSTPIRPTPACFQTCCRLLGSGESLGAGALIHGWLHSRA